VFSPLGIFLLFSRSVACLCCWALKSIGRSLFNVCALFTSSVSDVAAFQRRAPKRIGPDPLAPFPLEACLEPSLQRSCSAGVQPKS